MRVWITLRRCCVALGIGALAACSTLPTIDSNLAPPNHRQTRLEGANGHILSVRQSQAILRKLQSGDQPTNIFERHLALEQAISGAPLTIGNKVVLLENGPATYRAMLGAIGAATDSINMETYILNDDDVGQEFATALIAKQSEGVQVNLIHDGIGTLGTPAAYFERLRDAGINVLEFNPVNPLKVRVGWDVNQRDHRKLLIVDGQTGFLGGINISSVYSSGSGSGASRGGRTEPSSGELPWRDTDVQLQGPVVAELQKLFMQTWNEQEGPPLAIRRYFPPQTIQGSEVVRAIGGSPAQPFSLIYATLISAINSAETEILLTNAYFVPDPQLVDSLIAAAARGVDVKIIVPSTSDSWLVFRAGRSHYGQLLRGGVKLYERRNVLLHSKTGLIDGVWSTVGSANLDWRSFLHNQEVNAVILGTGFGDQLHAAFERDLAKSSPITLQQWRRRPIDDRFKEAFGRLWQYWL